MCKSTKIANHMAMGSGTDNFFKYEYENEYYNIISTAILESKDR